MSKEYENLAKVGSCSDFARKVLTLARRLGTDSLGLLEALLRASVTNATAFYPRYKSSIDDRVPRISPKSRIC